MVYIKEKKNRERKNIRFVECITEIINIDKLTLIVYNKQINTIELVKKEKKRTKKILFEFCVGFLKH